MQRNVPDRRIISLFYNFTIRKWRKEKEKRRKKKAI